jgi:hypothetical protein
MPEAFDVVTILRAEFPWRLSFHCRTYQFFQRNYLSCEGARNGFNRLGITFDAEWQLYIPVFVGSIKPELNIDSDHHATTFAATSRVLGCEGKVIESCAKLGGKFATVSLSHMNLISCNRDYRLTLS